ncbi:APC family permease [Deinococcus sp.]|uniref:APC family permease n=1 Tax=Deinococcus sp. TaxID=47478 RepID=UPI003C7CD439
MIQADSPAGPASTSAVPSASKLGLWGVVTVIYFAVAGGAFGIEGLIANSAPGMAILLILVTPFLWSLPTVLMVTELSTAMPVAGGYYAWVKRGLGPFWGFMQAWTSWLYGLVIAASFAVLFATYTSSFLSQAFGVTALDHSALLSWLVCAALIVAFVLLNIRGAHAVGDSSKLFAVMVFAPFIVMIVLALFRWLTHPGLAHAAAFWQPVTPPGTSLLSAFGLGLFVVMYNFLGWDGVSTILKEIENPLQVIPRAMRIALPVIVLAYLLPVLAGLVSGLKWSSWGDTTFFPELAASIGGRWLGIWMAVGGMFCAAGLFNAMVLTNSRIPFSLAADRYFPAGLTARHPVYGTPVVSIIVCAVIYALLSLQTFASLLNVTVLLYGVSLLLQFAALIAFRVKEPRMRRPFRIPGGLPVVVGLSLLPAIILVMAVVSTLQDKAKGPIFLALSLPMLAAGPLLFLLTRAVFKRGAPDVPVPIEYVD